jgi:hypothetical protein
MGRNPASFEKRRKEQARAEARELKAKKREQRREAERARPPIEGGDPDIDWIVPGPQPPPPDEGSADPAAVDQTDSRTTTRKPM